MKIKTIVAVLLLGFLGPAFSTTILPMSLEELTRRSDWIVVGKVKSVSYAQNEKSGYPETRVAVTIENTVYGDDKAQTVTLAIPGGPAGDGLVTIVPGMPQFKQDERAILFLVTDKNKGVSFPTGAEQGVFRIKTDPLTKESYVFNQSVDLSVINIPDNPVQEQSTGKSRIPLADFSIQLRQLAIQLKEK